MKRSIVKKQRMQVAVFFVSLLAGLVGAEMMFNFGPSTSYVTGDAAFNDGPGNATVGSTYIERQNYSSTTALTPSSGYTGPAFYGGYEITSTGLADGYTKRQVRDKTPEDYLFLQAYATGGYNGDMSVAGFFLFKQQDFLSGYETGSLSVTGLSVTVNCYNDGIHTQQGRWVVEKGGNLYVSQTALTIYGTTKVSVLGSDELWALYDPADAVNRLNFDQAGATFATMDLADITAAGIYYEHDLWAVGTGNEAFSFAVKDFEVLGAAVPEPASMVLLAFGGILVLGLRRKRR